MKRLLLSSAALGLLAGGAYAADIPVYEPAPMVAPVPVNYDWSGFYAGLNVGHAWTDIDRDTGAFQNSYEADGWFVGAQLGYNQQWGWFVGGVEIDGEWADIDGDDDGAGGTTDTTEIDWMGAANLRAGVALNRALVFATGGAAFANFEQSNDLVGTASDDQTFWGWTVGAGIDVAVTDHIVLGAAYRYVDFGSEDFDLGGGLAPFEIDADQHQVRFTGSYKW